MTCNNLQITLTIGLQEGEMKYKSFQEFLEANEINWKEFKKLCKPKNQNWTVKEFKDLTKPRKRFNEDKVLFLIHPFSWNGTTEGYDFWNKLCNKWSSYFSALTEEQKKKITFSAKK